MGAARDEIQIGKLETDWREVLWTPATMATHLSGGLWKPYPHLLALDSAVEGMIVHDTCDLLIVELPVRHGKSEYCSAWLPTWFLTRWPHKRVGLVTYGDDFAAEWGRKVRGFIEWHGERFGVTVDKRSSSADRWGITGTNGGMWTEGVGGQIIGKGYDLGIFDDPLKNDEEARNRNRRDKIWDWWQGTWMSRGEPGRKMVGVMSRWNTDDLVGRLKNEHAGLRIRVLTLPALAEENDPLGRQPGEALCPERYTREDLLALREATGPYIFSAQYQQTPLPEGGALLMMGNCGTYDVTAEGFVLGNRRLTSSEVKVFQAIDLAATTKTRSDYTVVGTFGVTPPGDILVLDIHRVKAESADHFVVMGSQYRKHKPLWIGIERATYGITLIQAARRAGLPVRELIPDGDKWSRAEAGRVMIEAGRVWLPRGAPWLHDFVTELTEFDHGRHDDQVDVFSYACGEVLRGLRGRKLKPESVSDRAEEHRRLFGRKKRTNHPLLGRF